MRECAQARVFDRAYTRKILSLLQRGGSVGVVPRKEGNVKSYICARRADGKYCSKARACCFPPYQLFHLNRELHRRRPPECARYVRIINFVPKYVYAAGGEVTGEMNKIRGTKGGGGGGRRYGEDIAGCDSPSSAVALYFDRTVLFFLRPKARSASHRRGARS